MLASVNTVSRTGLLRVASSLASLVASGLVADSDEGASLDMFR